MACRAPVFLLGAWGHNNLPGGGVLSTQLSRLEIEGLDS